MLCAAGALAGPMAPHRHSHMDFHLHKARDTGADEMLNWLESNAPAGEFPAAGGNTPAPPTDNSPAPEEKVEEAPVVVTTVTEAAPKSTSPAAAPAVHEKISGPAVAQQKAAPAVQSPAAPASSSGASPSGMPSAPTSFEVSMTSEDQAYKDLALLHHNIHRANHSVPALEWNETLYENAKQSAQTCVYQHTSPIPPYGERLSFSNCIFPDSPLTLARSKHRGRQRSG